MARTLNRLTANQVRSATGKQMLADGGGLYLQVAASGARSWLFRYRWQGKRPELGLGAYPAVSLSDARRRAEVARAALAELPPRDPKVALKAQEKVEALTFGAFATEWLDANLKDFRNAKHRQQWRNTLTTYAKPIWGNALDEIGTESMLNVLEPIWSEKRETAQRVRGRIERLLDAAKAKGLRSGENPARWRGHLNTLLPDQKKPRKHHAAMPFADVPAFMGELGKRGALSARALEFIILTGARSGEGRGAKWSEIDMDERIWTIPAARMKAGRVHRVPLSDAATAILEPLHQLRVSDFVFPKSGGPGCISETSIRNLMKRMDHGQYTTHGFRSSFRDWAGETTDFPREVAELALAHRVGDQVERAYRRQDALDKRRALMQTWAVFCGPRQ